MICKICNAVLPNGLEIEYCMFCRDSGNAISAWVDKIMDEVSQA